MTRLEYVAHPARRTRTRAALALALVAATAALAWASAGPALGLLAAVVLVLSVAPVLFPTRYTLDDEGVRARRLFRARARRWSDIRRVQAGPEAVLLSPFARPSWLDRTRSLVVFYDGHRDDVMRLLRDKVRC